MREIRLLSLAVLSLGTLFSSRLDGFAAHAVLIGCPAAVAILATVWREHEERAGRILLTVIGGIAFGQVLSVLLGPRVADLPTFDSLSYFFLAFGVPVTALLCVAAVFAEPLEADSDLDHDDHEEDAADASDVDRE